MKKELIGIKLLKSNKISSNLNSTNKLFGIKSRSAQLQLQRVSGNKSAKLYRNLSGRQKRDLKLRGKKETTSVKNSLILL